MHLLEEAIVYLRRINELERLADEEGIPRPTSDSMNDLFEFISKLDFTAAVPYLTLSDKGALRATWIKGSEDSKIRISLSFRGNSEVHYVIALPRNDSNLYAADPYDSEVLNYTYGTTTIDNIINNFMSVVALKAVMKEGKGT